MLGYRGSKQHFNLDVENKEIDYYDVSSHCTAKSNDDFESLLRRLQQNDNTLTVVSICDSVCVAKSDENFSLLANALIGNPYILSVKLANVNMKDRHCMHLSKAWETMSSLETLNVESNFLTGIGIEAIAAVAEHHPKLKHLYISNQRMSIGVAAERSLANCLSQNQTITTLSFNFRERFVQSYVERYLRRNKDIQQARVWPGSNLRNSKTAYPFPIRDIFEVAHDVMYPTVQDDNYEHVESLVNDEIELFKKFNHVGYSEEMPSVRPSFKLSFFGMRLSHSNKLPRSARAMVTDLSSDTANFFDNIFGGKLNNSTRTKRSQTMSSLNASSSGFMNEIGSSHRFSNTTKSSRSTRDTSATVGSCQSEKKSEQTTMRSTKNINASYVSNASEPNLNKKEVVLTLSLEKLHNNECDTIISKNPMLFRTKSAGNTPRSTQLDMDREKLKTEHISKMGSAFFVNSAKHSSSGKRVTPRHNFSEACSNKPHEEEPSHVSWKCTKDKSTDCNQNLCINADMVTPRLGSDKGRQSYRITSSKDGMHLRLTPTKQQTKGIASLFPVITDDE